MDTNWVFIDIRTAAANRRKVIPSKTSQIVGLTILFTSQSKHFMIRLTTAVIKCKIISVRNFQLIKTISVTITHQNSKLVSLKSAEKVTCQIQRRFFFQQRNIFQLIEWTLYRETSSPKIRKQHAIHFFEACFN